MESEQEQTPGFVPESGLGNSADSHFVLRLGARTPLARKTLRLTVCNHPQSSQIKEVKILVTGATGFVGAAVLKALRAEGCAARVLARQPDSEGARRAANEFGAEVTRGDVLDPGSLSPAMESVDAVVHLVGIISEAGNITFDNLHVRATRNVVEATTRAGVSRYIHMSALGTRPNAKSRYHQTKWAAEECVRASPLPSTIFRPSLIYGPEDHFINLFARMSRFSPLLPVMGNGSNRLQPVSVEGVGRAFVGALRRSESVGQTYDLCGPDTLSFNEILDTILLVLGRKRMKLHIPLPLARLQAGLLEFLLGKILRTPPPLNRDQLLMLQEDNVGNGVPADRLFGLEHPAFKAGIAKWLKP